MPGSDDVWDEWVERIDSFFLVDVEEAGALPYLNKGLMHAYMAATTHRCHACGEWSQMVHLLTIKPVCWKCFKEVEWVCMCGGGMWSLYIKGLERRLLALGRASARPHACWICMYDGFFLSFRAVTPAILKLVMLRLSPTRHCSFPPPPPQTAETEVMVKSKAVQQYLLTPAEASRLPCVSIGDPERPFDLVHLVLRSHALVMAARRCVVDACVCVFVFHCACWGTCSIPSML
jgi:hypothetical protein